VPAVCLAVMILLHASLVYEQYQTKSRVNIKAKAHSFMDLIVNSGYILFVVLHFFLQSALTKFEFLLIVVLLSALLSFLSVYLLPHYQLTQNLLLGAVSAEYCWCAVALAVSDLFAKPGVAVLLILVVSPLVVVLLREALEYRWKYIATEYVTKFRTLTNSFQVELATRAIIMRILELQEGDEESEKLKQSVIDIFNWATEHFMKVKMICVWETNFFLTIMKNQRVAMIKITKSLIADRSLEADFRVYCFAKMLEKHQSVYEELEYLQFRYYYEEAKVYDKEVCHTELEFWNELNSTRPRVSVLERLTKRLTKTIKLCVRSNKLLTKRYPSSHLALKQFGSFLYEILNNPKGKDYLAKADYERNCLTKKGQRDITEASYFSDEGAVVVVSGDPRKIGEITFINIAASEILGINPSDALGLSITNFIPEPYSKNHIRQIERFLLYGQDNRIVHCSVMFFLTHERLVVECFAEMRVSFLRGIPFILIALRLRSQTREVVIYTKSTGNIIGNSEGFAGALSLPYKQLTGANVVNILPEFFKLREKVEDFMPFNYIVTKCYPPVQAKLMFSSVKCNTQVISVLYIITDSKCHLEKEVKAFRDRKRTETIMEDIDLDQLRISFSQKQIGKFDNVDPTQVKKVDFGDEIIYEFNEGNVFQSFSFVKGMPELKDDNPPDHKRESDSDQRSKDELAQRIESSEGHLSNVSSVTSTGLRRMNMGMDDVMKSIEASSCRFKVVMVVMVALVSAAAISCLIFLTQAVQNTSSVAEFRQFAHRNCLNVAMATLARQLSMLNSGFAFETTESEMRAELLVLKNNYTGIVADMHESVPRWEESPKKNCYLYDEIVTVSLTSEHIKLQKRNLFNAMALMVDNAGVIIESALTDLKISNPSVFYLLRNGVGETLAAINTTNKLYLQDDYLKLRLTKMQVEMLLLTGILLLLGAFSLVIVPTIYFVEKNNKSVWSFLYELPREGLAELKLKCLERLDVVHGEDFSLQFKEEVRAVRKKTPRPSYKWRGMALKILLYICMSLAYFVTMWLVWTPNIAGLLRLRAVLMDWVEMEQFYVHSAYFWTQEKIVANSSLSYYDLSPVYQEHISIDYWLKNSTESIQYISRILLDGDQEVGVPNGFDDSTKEAELEKAGSGIFTQGLYAALNVFVHNIIRTRSQSDLNKRAAETKVILSLVNEKIDDYESRSTTIMQEYVNGATIFTAGYCVISLLLLLFLYFPLIRQVKQDITEVWDMRRLIPQELLQRQEITRRNRAIQAEQAKA